MNLRRHLLGATSLLAASAALAQPADRALVPILDAAAINQRCDGELAAARALIATMEKDRNPARLLPDFNRFEITSSAFTSPVYLLANVAVDKATRDAAQACIEKFTPLETEVFQSAALFKRVSAYKPRDAAEATYRDALLEGFQDTGASLPPAKRARVKAIADELSVLGLAFQKASNEDPSTVTLSVEEAAGMPPDWLAARKRDEQGRLVLGMDYPTTVPFLQNASNEEARRKVWMAFQNRGGQPNLERLDRALKLRYEMARLHGQPDYASLALRRRMAGTPKAVADFLGRVHAAVAEGEARELTELRAEKAALLNQPLDAVKVQRWDVSFLQERLKRSRYAIDQEKLRAYFPTEPSLQFAMKTAERLYGIEFAAPTTPVPLWHKDVRFFEVYERQADGSRGSYIGSAYLDLFPREGKFNHAAAFPVVPVSRLTGQKPASVLVANFNPKGLNHEELETLLHEFGHVLHGVLSSTRFAAQAGTAVKRDFVEAPSQMFEEWARRPETLALFAEVCSECPRLDAAQLKQLDEARKFGRGIRYARQWQYATFDMRLHTGAPKAALPVWAELERSMPLGYAEGSMLPANFGHLLGGYAAGYYGYMWSEVMALDMLSAFKGQLLDPAVGRRYRELILSRGGEVPPQKMVEAFLGRKPSADAFFAEITGRR
jgi:thimet oligopeptidase